MSDNTAKQTKAAVYQWAVPHYRAGFFAALIAHKEIDFNVCASDRYLGKCLAPDELPYHPIKVRRLHFPVIDKQVTFLSTLPGSVLKRRFDVIIVPNDIADVSVWLALFLSRLTGVKLCLWGHGFSKRHQGIADCVRKVMMRLADAVLFYSDKTRDQWIQKGLPEKKLFVAYNALNTHLSDAMQRQITPEQLKHFQAEHGLDGKQVILTVGRMYDRRQLPLLFEACGRLLPEMPDLRIVMIGDGPEVPHLKDCAARNGLAEVTCFTGAIHDEQTLAQYFLSSHLTVIPAAAGLSVQHTFAYGLPTVMGDDYTTHGPEAALVQDGVTGRICRFGDADDFAAAIRHILTDTAYRKRLSENARRIINEKYNLDTMVDGFRQVVEYCAEHKK